MIELDDIDKRIVAALQADGRLAVVNLAGLRFGVGAQVWLMALVVAGLLALIAAGALMISGAVAYAAKECPIEPFDLDKAQLAIEKAASAGSPPIATERKAPSRNVLRRSSSANHVVVPVVLSIAAVT